MPLEDGRARAVYRNDELVMEVGGGVSPECADAIRNTGGLPSSAYVSAHAGGHVWVPIYYGPRIIVVNRGFAPPPRRAAVAGTRPNLNGPGVSSLGGGGSTSSGSSGGSFSGGDLKEAAVVLAVIALIALPAITIGLAVGRPEPEAEVASVMDRVNLYNDMARTPGSPCYVYTAAAAPGGRAQ